MADWTTEQVQEEVKKQSQVTKSMGLDKLKQLKSELKQLCLDFPAISKNRLDKDGYWGHRGVIIPESSRFPLDPYRLNPNWLPEDLIEPSEEMSKHCGDLLYKYGFMKRAIHYGCWSGTQSSGFRYISRYTISPELKKAVLNYGSSLEQLRRTKTRRAEIVRQKSEAEAQDLWDQV